jgi:hypothetical protein
MRIIYIYQHRMMRDRKRKTKKTKNRRSLGGLSVHKIGRGLHQRQKRRTRRRRRRHR